MELGYFLTEAGCNQHDPEKTPWIPKDVPRSPQKYIHAKLSIYADSSHSDLDFLTHLATNLLSVATHRKGVPGLDWTVPIRTHLACGPQGQVPGT